MRNWKENFLRLCRNRIYILMLSFTAVCSYGFLITHQSVGIDDTPYAYYFEEGLNVIVGRWFLFLVNKIFHISDFSPFITDFVGVLIFMAAVTVWCALLYAVCGDRVPVWGYVFFSCIFLSCPLISEIYTYYLHNGVSLGYLCTGISLHFFYQMSKDADRRKGILAVGLGTAIFLFIAMGCYESFMVVWLVGILLVLLTEQYMGRRGGVFRMLGLAGLAAVSAVLLRSIMIAGCIGFFGLGEMRDEAVQRSVAEILGWMFEPGASAEFAMALKRIYVMYGVFAYAYYPIKIFVLAACFMILSAVCTSVRRRNGWIAALTFGCFIASFLLVVIEGKATLYRSAQFLPVICGYGAFLAFYAVEGLRGIRLGGMVGERTSAKRSFGRGRFCRRRDCAQDCPGSGIPALVHRIGSGLLVFGLCAVLWNQCFDMNKWFYVDWMKYQAALDTMGQIAVTLESSYDTSKPVVFTGTYQAPKGIIADAYVDYGTETFYKINRLTGLVDEHLLEKFYREYGVWVAQKPALTVFDWGINAFGTDEELARFFAMHGHAIRANTDQSVFEEASAYSIDLPNFPEEGSIVDAGDYIIVHF